MILPENIERKNTKVFEEVNIPPSDAAPTHVGQQRVKIDHLDDVSSDACSQQAHNIDTTEWFDL